MEETFIEESQVRLEFYKSTERFHIIACWVGMALNMVWFLSDYFVIPQFWFTFLLFRIGVTLTSLLTLVTRNIIGINIYTCMFILVVGISIQNAYMWSVMDISHFQKHAFAYMVLFIGVGMLVLWEVWLSVALLVITIISNIIFYLFNSKLTIEEYTINGGLLTLTVVIFCVFLIRSRYRLTFNEIKSRLELAKSKEIIEQKHEQVLNQKKEITDSINYAKSIQQSLIPLESSFINYFNDSFVFFKPKDIVSGDFYWIYEKDNLIFYATADCTGHGVPGGFMTMLGISFLDEIVEVKEVKQPSEILNLLRDKIVVTLKQKGNFGENKDGMDITVCCIDKSKNELQYSTANNPLYIIKNAGTPQAELLVYKADKQPCGFYHEYKPFTNNVIQLQNGDCIYTFSDGLADQFGEKSGKKYMYKQLKSLLLQNAHLNFEEQKSILNSSFTAWKGMLEQVDDVLVIGIKI